jgi:hypothetical protein
MRRISEHRRRRYARFLEGLPKRWPGIDPDDYDLFRKIVDNKIEEK